MKKLISLRFLFCMVAAFAFFAVASYFFPRTLIKEALPILTVPIDAVHPDFKMHADLEGINALSLDVTTLEYRGAGSDIQRVRKRFKIIHEIGTLFGIPLVFYTLLFAWPGIPLKYRFRSAALTIPVIFLMVTADISLTLLFEISKQLIAPTPVDRISYYLAQALNCGGRQFLGILLFAAVISPRILKAPEYNADVSAGRNSPCPCGSGKKYKNCCMA